MRDVTHLHRQGRLLAVPLVARLSLVLMALSCGKKNDSDDNPPAPGDQQAGEGGAFVQGASTAGSPGEDQDATGGDPAQGGSTAGASAEDEGGEGGESAEEGATAGSSGDEAGGAGGDSAQGGSTAGSPVEAGGASGEGGSPAMASGGEAGEADQVITPEEGYAIREDFDSWEGDGGRDFFLSKGDSEPYSDHNTVQNIADHDCLYVHADAVDNGGFGFSAEVQMNLDAQTDMSAEDWEISYDIYLPSQTYDLGANLQFGLYRTSDFTPIYSVWYSGSLVADEWVTLTTPITTTDGLISYSGFENDPEDWIFDAVRIQTIVNGTTAAVGSEIAFCIDNLTIRQLEPEELEEREDQARIDAPTPYAVWVDGQPVPVERLGKFDVPVNYVRTTHPGEEIEVEIASSAGLGGFSLSPSSDAIPTEAGANMLTLRVQEPTYLILEVPGQERLFLLLDPAEESPPAPDDEDVRNVVDEGADNTGATDCTEILQGAIDAASDDPRDIVYVPPGVYATRRLNLRDDMTLYLADGAVLQNATPQDELLSAPEDLTQIEGAAEALIVMNGITGAKLLGRGTLDGNGAELQSYGRKMFVLKIENSSDIEVDGIIARDSAFWSTLVYRSTNVQISNYKVINNQLAEEWNETDGVDFDNCVDSGLRHAFLYTGDDCMAVKSDDIPDDLGIEGILDPTEGDYLNVSNITHTDVVCHSASSGCKVGTKTFGDTMSDIEFADVDIVQAERGLVIDAVDTATIDGTLFDDVRMESIRGRLVDFNMDPEAITWRPSPGTCTVTDTTVRDVVAHESGEVAINGNVHNWNEEDPYYGNQYWIDGVAFENFTVAGTVVTSLGSEAVSFAINEYVRNVTFEPSEEVEIPEVDTTDYEWLPSWATTIQRTEDRNEPPPLGDKTLRQFVWPSYPGQEIRLQLSNERGEAPVEITSVHIARAMPLGRGEIDASTDTAFTWEGESSVTIPEGETAWSDPVSFDLEAMEPMAITMHFASAPVDVTGHPGARTTSYIADGDVVSAATLSGETRDRWYFIDAIEVMAPPDANSVAILGDSIADGYGVLNQFARWPDFLNRAISEDETIADRVSVLNFGMGGNCLTAPGENDDMDSGVVRFERDVLGRAEKIRWLIVFIGVNDMIYCEADADTITAAYQDIIDRSHDAGIAVYGATITPFGSNTTGDPLAVRDEVNEWITTSGEFDAVIDFAAMVADPRDPSQLNPPLSNDGLHPNLAGYEVLGNAVDLSLFYETLAQQ